ncbi:MAG: YceH family protein [Pyrinomonadaceae bacterium]
MPEILTEIEARVLGSLVEKQLTTPEYYPLTLNALVNACNQKSNRDPVVSYDEATVNQCLENLRDHNLVYVFYGSTSRVPKYKHMVPSVYELEPPETAVIDVMMLRGPQTLGELRTRTERLCNFSGLGQIQEALDGLIRRDEPLVVKLPVQPGQKEARFAHLLSGDIDVEALAVAQTARMTRGAADAERVEKLEDEVASLRAEIEALKTTFELFKNQFE